MAVRMPIPMGRSKPLPSFLTPAGDRFIVILLGGMVSPIFLTAVRTLSLASLTSELNRPTISREGRPGLTSTSISTGSISIPLMVPLWILQNMI